jgi:hypothetical protein
MRHALSLRLLSIVLAVLTPNTGSVLGFDQALSDLLLLSGARVPFAARARDLSVVARLGKPRIVIHGMTSFD